MKILSKWKANHSYGHTPAGLWYIRTKEGLYEAWWNGNDTEFHKGPTTRTIHLWRINKIG